MKKQFIAILYLLSIPLFSQTQMMIYKTNGTVDSILVSQISNITFSTASDTVPNQGLSTYWPLDGNAVDSSGNGYNGIVYGATPAQNRFGVNNSAYSFNGNDNAIDFGNILNQIFCAPVAKFSVSGWALISSNESNINSTIINKTAGGNGPYQWSVYYSNGTIRAGVYSDTLARNYIELQSPVSFNQWYHFVLIFDGSQPELQRVQLYINGSTSSTSLYSITGNLGSTTTATQQNIAIGASHAPNSLIWSDFFNGDVDDIRIYNRALSAAEVTDLYMAPS
jgi:hypothetical protein